MKTLVLHIGMAKTGTSAIQNSLGLACAALRERRIFCAPWKPFNHSFDFTVLFMGEPRKSFFYKQLSPIDEDSWQRQLERLRLQWQSLFESADNGTWIVSAENLTRLSPAEIRRLQEWVAPYFDEVRAIAYVRDPLKALKSQWEQNVKEIQEPIDAQSLLARTKERMGYRFLQCWSGTLGADNLILRKFDPAAFHNESLLDDFFYALGLELPPEAAITDVESNQSLGPEGTAFLLELNNRYPQYLDGAYNPQRGLARRLHLFYRALRKAGSAPLELDLHFSEEEAERYNRKIRSLNQFLPDGAGFPEVEPDSGVTRLPGVDDISIDYVVSMVNELALLADDFVDRKEHLEKDNRRLKAELESLRAENRLLREGGAGPDGEASA